MFIKNKNRRVIILRFTFNYRIVLTLFFFLVVISFADDNDGWSKFVPNRSKRVISIEIDTSGSVLWVGTIDGLYRKEGSDIRTHGPSVNLPTEVVEDISIDIWNRPWCIVDGQVYIYTTFKNPEEEIVSTWVPCLFGGLDSLQEVYATCMAQGPLDIVIGTNTGLIYSKNITRVKDTSSTGLGLPTRVLPEGSTIYEIIHWKGSYYFLSTSRGLFKLFNGRVKGVQRIGSKSDIRFTAIQSDTVSTIWFADTVYIGQIDTTRRVSIVNMMPLTNIHSMCFDSIGHLWCASDTSLFEVYPRELVYVQHQLPKAPRIEIGPLLALSTDSILSGTNKGLYLYNVPRPVVSVKVIRVDVLEKGVLLKLKVSDFSTYPYLLLKWSIDESDYSEWLNLEAKASHTLDIGKLDKGEHRIKIIIKPPLENVGSTETSYRFSRGFYIRLWMWIVGGAVLIFIGLSISAPFISKAIRIHHTKVDKMRRAKSLLGENPYISGPPIREEEKFVGRQVILEKVLAGVHNNSFLIHGEQRIGKTSLLYQIRNRIRAFEDKKYKVESVMVNLQTLPERRTPKTFYTLFARTIARAIYSKRKRDYDQIIRKKYDYSEFELFMEDVSDYIRRRYRKKEARVVLLIDEGDIMAEFGPGFQAQFRGLFVSSVTRYFNIVLMLREFTPEWRLKTSPWYNFFNVEPLEPMTKEETFTLVQKYVEEAIEFKKQTLNRIWEITQGHPFKVQKLCSIIYNSLGNKVYVRLKDVSSAYRKTRGSL